jgi:Arginosuccinate synthase
MERLVFPVLTPSAADVLAPLAARPDLDVIAVALDVGSGVGLDGLRDMALVAGAVRCHVVDTVDALAASVCWPVLRAGALAVPGEPVLTALTMPVVAETLADICRHEQATTVGVWAEDPADRRRLRALLKALAGWPRPTSGPASSRRTGRPWRRRPGSAGRRTCGSASSAVSR